MASIAHISDLHFSKASWGFAQLFSKRLIGNLNLLLRRRHLFQNALPFSLIDIFKREGVSHLIISGDLTTTSYKKEYNYASAFVEELKKINIKAFLIPGNHDHYTKKDDKAKLFYRYFPTYYPLSSSKSEIDTFTLSNHGVTTCPLVDGWRLVLLDTTCATSLFSSNGFFSPIIEKNLTHLLNLTTPNEKIILVNHFPLVQKGQSSRRQLLRGEALQVVLQNFPNVHLYLHGHTHHNTIADLRSNGLPLTMDSGSAGHLKGSWNLMTLSPNQLQVKVYQWNKNWFSTHHQSFHFDSKPWYSSGAYFKCTRCGKCCSGRRVVWLNEHDTKRLSSHLEISEREFLKKYTHQLGFDLSLKIKPKSGDCIFLKDKICSQYMARPRLCRTFPWWTNIMKNRGSWNQTKKWCEGIDHKEAPLISFEEIKKQLD